MHKGLADLEKWIDRNSFEMEKRAISLIFGAEYHCEYFSFATFCGNRAENFIINSTLCSVAHALVTNIYIISETNVKDNWQCEGYVI